MEIITDLFFSSLFSYWECELEPADAIVRARETGIDRLSEMERGRKDRWSRVISRSRNAVDRAEVRE